MGLVTLAEAKEHLRVTDSAEDSLIQIYIDAATEHIRNFLNSAVPGENHPTSSIPAPIRASCLMMVEDYYSNRSAQVAGEELKPNPAAINLIYPYRKEIGF